MKLLSVSVSLPKEIPYRGKTVSTGIFKEPVAGRVTLRKLNLDGDGQADLQGHGGVHKAVYAYPFENYAYWKRELGRDDFTFGQFGENFTVEGMPDDEIYIGDQFRVGSARLEVSQPRVPCFKLGIRMENPGFIKPFLRSCLVGYYFRVLEEGEVEAGDLFERVQTDPERLSVREVCRLYYFDRENLDGAKKALRVAALTPAWRPAFEERLAAAGIAVDLSEESVKAGCCGP